MLKHDVPAGEFRWITVVSPDDPDGTELLLEPNENPVAQTYQKGIFDQGIPANSFGVADIHAEHERLKALGVSFTMEPTEMGPVTIAVFDDTCGNLIQINADVTGADQTIPLEKRVQSDPHWRLVGHISKMS